MFSPDLKVWMDGKIINFDEARVHILTHTLHYGTGPFDGIRFYESEKGPVIFRLKEHLERLFYSASVFQMKIPYSIEALTTAVCDTIKGSNLTIGYIRPIVYFGSEAMGLNPSRNKVHVAIAVWNWGAYLGDREAKVKVSSIRRISPKMLKPEAKISGHYVNSIIANLEAKKAGFDEALLLDIDGYIAEGSGENFFVVKSGELHTPAKGSILPGITRNSVMIIAQELGIRVFERQISVDEAKKADELFFTGTASEVHAICQLDEVVIGTGKIGAITSLLRDEYAKVVRGKNSKFLHWLTFIN